MTNLLSKLLRGSGRSAARGRGFVDYTAPLIAPIFAPLLAVIAPIFAAFLAVFAPLFAAFHPRGLSLGIRNGQNRGWQRQA
jgi:hypothetical protein